MGIKRPVTFIFKFCILQQAVQLPRGRRRKIEIPTDSQPQFELGDTAEDIEKKRRKRGERGERVEKTRGEGQREDRVRDEGREPGKARKESTNRYGY